MKDNDNDLDIPNKPIGAGVIFSDSSNSSRDDLENVDEHVDLDEVDVDIENETRGFNVSVAQEETRAKIALHFTNFFLTLVAASLVIPFILNLLVPVKFDSPIENAKELITVLSSVLAGPFGFIVGFYFKQNDSK